MYTLARMLQLSGLLALLLTLRVNSTEENEEATDLAPHVFISVLITNSLHLMPNFFGYLEGLDYPKDRISIWIHTDHNVDGTRSSLSMWCRKVKRHYKSVDCHSSRKWVYPTKDPYSKSVHRYKNKARLRQQALEAAREAGADYMLTLDADCFLVNSRTLHLLIEQNKTIVAPMLDAGYKLAYSNFWMAQDDLGNYEDDDLYMPIVQRDRVGCFSAPVVFGAVLIHLSSLYTENLVYHPPHPKFIGPVNDVLQFAFSARSEVQTNSAKVPGLPKSTSSSLQCNVNTEVNTCVGKPETKANNEIGVAMHVLNTEFFGYIMKDEKYKDTNEASRDFFQFKLDTLVNHPPVLYSKFMKRQMPIIRNPGLELDAVYVINLARRPGHRGRMAAILEELGYNYTIVNAVDGRDLNVSYVEDELRINRRDKYKNLTMRMGEVGCFLSHHSIWKKVISENQRKVLVLEDDAYFQPHFTKGLYSIMIETKLLPLNWDYIYLGRNRVDFSRKEKRVKGSKWLIHPNYSYFALAYLLSNRGAYKLLAADPFHYLLPVDEFIAIMYGAHPMREYSEQFPVRDLEVYSAHPTLIKPTHYEGQDGRISDIEAETIIDIMEKKKEEEMSEVDASHRENVKKKAVQRQIEAVKMKIKARDEL